MEERYSLRCMNVFHAGDGNLHPLILFDANTRANGSAPINFGAEILELCVRLGGTITGEHGVGIEKINSMLRAILRRRASDVLRGQGGVRRNRPVEPRQSNTHARALRRIRQDACACRSASPRRPATLLTHGHFIERRPERVARTRNGSPRRTSTATAARRRHQGLLRQRRSPTRGSTQSCSTSAPTAG